VRWGGRKLDNASRPFGCAKKKKKKKKLSGFLDEEKQDCGCLRRGRE